MPKGHATIASGILAAFVFSHHLPSQDYRICLLCCINKLISQPDSFAGKRGTKLWRRPPPFFRIFCSCLRRLFSLLKWFNSACMSFGPLSSGSPSCFLFQPPTLRLLPWILIDTFFLTEHLLSRKNILFKGIVHFSLATSRLAGVYLGDRCDRYPDTPVKKKALMVVKTIMVDFKIVIIIEIYENI